MVEKDTLINDAGYHLPLHKDWVYRPYDLANFTIPDGTDRVIMDLRRRGWVLWALVMHNSPNMGCIFELETVNETFSKLFTTNELFAMGAVQAQSNGWWIARYDTVQNLYTVMFTPAEFQPFYRRCKVTLRNQTGAPAFITRVGILCIEFLEPNQMQEG